MKPLNLDEVRQYVNENIDTFHGNRLTALSGTTLASVVKKNPYLSRAKNVTKASELVERALAAKLSSSEEELFGVFLEDLAIFVAEKTTGGHKSGVSGIDLEFDSDGWHYFVSIKSGVNWGNETQQAGQEAAFTTALKVYKQRKGQRTHADAILGICYGKTKTNRVRGALKLVGQNFWSFISGNKELYKEIVEPIGYRAKEHNDAYEEELGKVINNLTLQFIQEYCNPDGSIDWYKLVEVTCGNYDLNDHGFSF
jgi:hypothetical protein